MSFAGGVNAGNGFGGGGQVGTQGNAGATQTVVPQVTQDPTQVQQIQTQNPQVNQGVPGGQQTGQAPTDEFGHRIKSALAQQEQTLHQTWQQQNATALQLEAAVRALGHDPSQVIQRIQEQQRQAQIEAQQAQGISPQMAQHMQNMENQLQSVQRVLGEQRLVEAERNLTTFAGNYGVDYSTPQVQMEIRQFALDNNVNLDTAFKSLYFDRIMQVNTQQAQGATIAAMQGRGPAPISTAVPGLGQQGPIDYLNMSDKDFAVAEAQMRNQHNQR